MWKDYSLSYIKNNKASSISLIAAAFISALLLSLLCSLFYNFWASDVKEIIRREGDWQARITGGLTENDLNTIENFGNVEKAVINKDLSQKNGATVIDLYFEHAETVFEDMPLLVRKLGISEAMVSYHVRLLALYLIHDPQDETPPLLLTYYLAILLIVALSLILIIRNSFALSMNARIHQFGIFTSIGATPGQIRTCLIQEAAALCMLPVLLGCLIGIMLSVGIVQAMNLLADRIAGAYAIRFTYHPLVFVFTMIAVIFTVLVSAWLPAGKLSRMTPLEAIRNTGELTLRRKKHSRILSLLFGIEGELAGNALKAQAKAMRTSTLSLTLSFLGFTLLLCFFTLSGISTKHTYFERYQNAWDVMATITNTEIGSFSETETLRNIPGLQDLLVYQKAEAVCLISQEYISQELTALGGPGAVAGASVSQQHELWSVKAPLVILDDQGFLSYCEALGITPGLNGTIILNRIWDSVNSVWRYPDYVPFLSEKQQTIPLRNAAQEGSNTEIPVLGFVQEAPLLREEYDRFSLVQFMPVSLWKKISGQLGGAQTDTYVRILAEEKNELSSLNTLQQKVEQILTPEYEIVIENRIQEKHTNDDMILGYLLILGGLCCLLALIGIANVFSNTLGFLRQRKREFARYLSVGMEPASLRKMFCIEALVIAGRPILITLPLTAVITGFMIRASYLNPMEFIAQAPVLPILIFCLAICLFVALAYYLGGKKVLQCNLSDALRDDTIA